MTGTANEATLTKPGAPPHTPENHGEELRNAMLVWARWCIQNSDRFTYVHPSNPAGHDRAHMVNSPPGSLPQEADCTSFIEGLAKWVGASDPSGLNYNPVGFTGTILKHCNTITVTQVRMGDLIVYGPGNGDHGVFVMERLPKNDFWCASFGSDRGPERVLHSKLLAYFDNSARYRRWLS